MICIGSFFSKLFGVRKSARSTFQEVSPPPYEHLITRHGCINEKSGSQLLNPNLSFTATEIEAQLVSKDIKFAAAVVELMVPRLKLGVWKEPVGWGHYTYTLDKVHCFIALWI